MNQETYPDPKHSKKRFFHRQDRLENIEMHSDLWGSMKDMDAIVLAVRHSVFMDLDPDEVFKAVGKPFAIVDCFTILDDQQIERYFQIGCEVKGMGRGHINRIKRKVRDSQ